VPFMNPAPFSVQEECPTSRVYRLYDQPCYKLVPSYTHSSALRCSAIAELDTDLERACSQVPGNGTAASGGSRANE
jgi:hypothetical protein